VTFSCFPPEAMTAYITISHHISGELTKPTPGRVEMAIVQEI